jgi:hypothetical protein
VKLFITQFSPVSCYSFPFPSLRLTDNLSHPDSNTVLYVLICSLLDSRCNTNNTACGCSSRQHVYFPLPSKELCLSPIHCLSPHISEHKLITCHLAQQINYFHSPSHRPYPLQHQPSSSSTPRCSLNALSKYDLSLVRFDGCQGTDCADLFLTLASAPLDPLSLYAQLQLSVYT